MPQPRTRGVPTTTKAGGRTSPLRHDADPRAVKPGMFRMWGTDVRRELVCLLGPEPPKPVRGHGGIEHLARAGRWSVPYYAGSDPLAFEVTLMLEDREIRRDSTAEKWRTLEVLAGFQDREKTEPPVVRWNAGLPHHDFGRAPTLDWRVESLTWDDFYYGDDAGLVWATATILLGFDATADEERFPLLERATPFRREVMRRGESLREFAKRVLGNAKRWKDIQSLNRDNSGCPTNPEYEVKRALELRVPPRDESKR